MRSQPWMLWLSLLVALVSGVGAPQAQDAPNGKPSTSGAFAEAKRKDNKLSHGVLAAKTRYETSWFAIESGVEGPSVLLTGGVHGDEPAGAEAAGQIRHWTITKGKLIVVPRVNPLALAKKSRFIPDVPEEERDLNRNFGEKPKGELAEIVWDFVKSQKADWLIDLHEGFDFRVKNDKSVGSSVIAADNEEVSKAAFKMVEAANTCLISEDVPFQSLKNPIAGSLARASFDQLGIKSMICETTTKGQRLPFRARQHRIMVHALLNHLGMVDKEVTPNQMRHRDSKVRSVALYDSSGSAGAGVPKVLEHVDDEDKLEVVRVCARDIQASALMQFESVIFSGGSGSGQAKSLDELGRKKVRAFVREGGGYVGICAGAYLACTGFSWGLGILDAKTKSPLWKRGTKVVEASATAAATKELGLKKSYKVLYANGPILEPANDDEVPDYQVLSTFTSEVAENKTPKGIMIGSPAMVTGTFGKGRVLVSSPHPEQTKGLEDWVVKAIDFVAAKEGN